MSQVFEISFNSTFSQDFTFSSSLLDSQIQKDLKITAQTHPFIKTDTSIINSVIISVNGPQAYEFTKAKSDLVESISINVNGEQSFNFSIKLLIPQTLKEEEIVDS